MARSYGLPPQFPNDCIFLLVAQRVLLAAKTSLY